MKCSALVLIIGIDWLVGATNRTGVGGEVAGQPRGRVAHRDGGAPAQEVPQADNADDTRAAGGRPRHDQSVQRRYPHAPSPLQHHRYVI